MQGFDDIASPEFYDCFSSPKPLITPSKLFLGDCADERAIDWTILENCNPNLVDTPKSVRNSETKKQRKSLIPVFSPTATERQPSGILTASGSRGSKSRRISKEITEVLASRASSSSSGRKSSAADKETILLRELAQKQAQEIFELQKKISVLESQHLADVENIEQLQQKVAEQETMTNALRDELSAVCFFTQVQGQKIEEQESLIMTSKMDYQEELSTKNRKYKSMIKKMQADKANYESGANTVIQQLNDQMAQLQKFALTRIETLEKQQIDLRRAKDVLAEENTELKAQVLAMSTNTASSANASSSSSTSANTLRARSLSPMAPPRAHNGPSSHTSSNSTAAAVRTTPAVIQPAKVEDQEEDDDEEEEEDEEDEQHASTPPAVNKRGHMMAAVSPFKNETARTAVSTLLEEED